MQDFIFKNTLEDIVYIYGPKKNISDYLQFADIGILTSISEGLPLSLIEYAMTKTPVVVSDVAVVASFVFCLRGRGLVGGAAACDDAVVGCRVDGDVVSMGWLGGR